MWEDTSEAEPRGCSHGDVIAEKWLEACGVIDDGLCRRRNLAVIVLRTRHLFGSGTIGS